MGEVITQPVIAGTLTFTVKASCEDFELDERLRSVTRSQISMHSILVSQVCCSVLQCAEMCCSVLQCVAV